MIEENELPRGWAKTTLGEICSKPQYGWTTKANHREGLIKLLRTTDISGGFIDWDMVPYCTEIPENLDAYKLTEGDIVISRAGSVGVSYLLSLVPMETVFASYLIRFRPYPQIEARYMAHYLQTSTYWKSVYEQSSGIALANVNASKLEKFEIPLASQSEQQRIVTAIEQQFTRLDAAVTALQHTRTKLKRYRASVLKAAVEGKLTEAWRAEHPATEPASALLERILVERRAKWEADLRAKGKDPSKIKYVEPARPDLESLPELTEGWCWSTIGQIVSRSEYGTSVKCDYKANGVPVLRIPNIAAGEIDISDMKYSLQPLALNEDNALEVGDLLVCRTNGSVSLIGKAALVQIPLKPFHTFASYLLRFRFLETTILPKWLHLFLSSPQGRKFIESNAASSAGQHNISLTLMHSMCFSIPPLLEQQQIVAEVERRLSIVTQVEATVEANLKRAGKLRQSILKEAFAGRLVPQDPNDEPASTLLERIHKEREEQKRGSIGKQRTLKNISVPKVPDVEPVDIDASEMEQMDLWSSIGSRE